MLHGGFTYWKHCRFSVSCKNTLLTCGSNCIVEVLWYGDSNHQPVQFDIYLWIIILSDIGTPFPKNYMATVKKIMTRLFRVFVHIYMHHFDKMVALGAVSCDSLFEWYYCQQLAKLGTHPANYYLVIQAKIDGC